MGFDPDKTIETAMHIFWEKGYDRTTLDDILEATNISKSSFYNSYGNKYNIFEKCLDLFCDTQIELIETNLKQVSNGRVFIESFLRELVQAVRMNEPHCGCFLLNTAHEFSGRDVQVSQMVSCLTIRFSAVFQKAVENGQAAGVINQDKEPGILAYFILSSIAGLRQMISAQVNPDQLDQIVDITLAALD